MNIKMNQFLVILRGKGALDYNQEELGHRINEYNEWVSTIQDHYLSDNRLEREGALITGKGKIQTDGPFLEAKEIIAGYVMIQAKDLNQAIQITESCPLLKYFEMMVRPVIGPRA